MSEGLKFDLLRDLAGLLRKYDRSTFADLAIYLRNPESRDELVHILDALAVTPARTRRQPSRKHQGPSSSHSAVKRFLSDTLSQEPEKAHLLSSLFEAVVARRVLSTLRELRDFAADNGLRAVTATSKDNALAPFFRDLASRPVGELRTIVERVPQPDSRDDRALEGWTNVILEKRTQKG